jgi:hypothetical protein
MIKIILFICLNKSQKNKLFMKKNKNILTQKNKNILIQKNNNKLFLENNNKLIQENKKNTLMFIKCLFKIKKLLIVTSI